MKQNRSPAAARAQRSQIDQALAAGDVAQAAKLAERELAAGRADPLTLNLAAWRREEAGDFAAAHALLRRALAISPGDVAILGSVGAVLRKQGFLTEALAVLDGVVAAEPRHAAAWLERGYVLDAQRADAAARASYERALALDSTLSPALGKLADTAARRGDVAGAKGYAQRALSLNPHEPSAVFALALLAVEARDGARAEALLRPLLATPLALDDRTRSLTLLGDALDRLDRPDEAFDAYRAAQATFRQAYNVLLAPTADRPSHRAFIQAIHAQVAATGAVVALPGGDAVPGAAATHVFLLGYPRSGTTLVENVLASARDVVALEERDTLVDIDVALLANDGTMPALDTLDPALLHDLRMRYWARVATLAGTAVTGKVLVDMNPFNGIKLPILSRLFPQARFVIMRRDPRDVVLSCFRVNFTPGAGAWAFSDIEEAARHYDALMRLIDLARATLPIATHEVRYDRLVGDFKPTVRALADFIGLAWTDAFAGFATTARDRGVRTASETQVRKGLYNGGGQWRRYADQLAPVLPILAPWVERFGSGDED
ncbi:sulfotransferase [Sphingomonas sp. RB3P16]|uniref:tetratricopeptide repeat-containing sulfotransferase family protein n=1 Tax=Parasphingomonas frigoris TaxID=3096163 RepID=UPI002FCA6F26